MVGVVYFATDLVNPIENGSGLTQAVAGFLKVKNIIGVRAI
jgi:hypothetical protein